MKILVLQLARYGDILLSYPAIQALKRTFPEAQIDLMVRERYQEACFVFQGQVHLRLLRTGHLLQPVYESENVEDSLDRLDALIFDLKNQGYDKIINLSFSPFSSYLTEALASEQTTVAGYTRHSDGALQLPDNVSTYFYAQVGLDKWNRWHLTDLLTGVAQVELLESDLRWTGPLPNGEALGSSPSRYITIHIGASQDHKTLPPFLWARIIKNFLHLNNDTQIVLIGAKNEKWAADEICGFMPSNRVVNLAGKTDFAELFEVIGRGLLHIGPDSVTIHIASLLNHPCFNLSVGDVRFWETGCRSRLSFGLRYKSAADVSAQLVAENIHKYLTGAELDVDFVVDEELNFVDLNDETGSQFSWNLLKAIYTGEKFPVADDEVFVRQAQRLNWFNRKMIEALNQVSVQGLEPLSFAMNEIETEFVEMEKLDPNIGIFIRWYQAEKTKVPPQTQNRIVEEYLRIHNNFEALLRPYVMNIEPQEEGTNLG